MKSACNVGRREETVRNAVPRDPGTRFLPQKPAWPGHLSTAKTAPQPTSPSPLPRRLFGFPYPDMQQRVSQAAAREHLNPIQPVRKSQQLIFNYEKST
jgi:hypothetical protein